MTENTKRNASPNTDEIIVTGRDVTTMVEMFWRDQDPAIIWTGKTVRVVTGAWLDRYGDRFPNLTYIAGADEYTDMDWEGLDPDTLAEMISVYAGDLLAESATD